MPSAPTSPHAAVVLKKKHSPACREPLDSHNEHRARRQTPKKARVGILCRSLSPPLPTSHHSATTAAFSLGHCDPDPGHLEPRAVARARDRFPSADPVARRSLSPDEAGHKFAAKVGAHVENTNGVVRGRGGAESAKYNWFFLCCTLKILLTPLSQRYRVVEGVTCDGSCSVT